MRVHGAPVRSARGQLRSFVAALLAASSRAARDRTRSSPTRRLIQCNSRMVQRG
jgi:hypothetical protein